MVCSALQFVMDVRKERGKDRKKKTVDWVPEKIVLGRV